MRDRYLKIKCEMNPLRIIISLLIILSATGNWLYTEKSISFTIKAGSIKAGSKDGIGFTEYGWIAVYLEKTTPVVSPNFFYVTKNFDWYDAGPSQYNVIPSGLLVNGLVTIVQFVMAIAILFVVIVRHRTGFCDNCGYDIGGCSEKTKECPECGAILQDWPPPPPPSKTRASDL